MLAVMLTRLMFWPLHKVHQIKGLNPLKETNIQKPLGFQWPPLPASIVEESIRQESVDQQQTTATRHMI